MEPNEPTESILRALAACDRMLGDRAFELRQEPGVEHALHDVGVARYQDGDLRIEGYLEKDTGSVCFVWTFDAVHKPPGRWELWARLTVRSFVTDILDDLWVAEDRVVSTPQLPDALTTWVRELIAQEIPTTPSHTGTDIEP